MHLVLQTEDTLVLLRLTNGRISSQSVIRRGRYLGAFAQQGFLDRIRHKTKLF